jgi:hypothetical protein
VSIDAVAVARPRSSTRTWRLHLHRPSPVVLCFVVSLLVYEAAACYVSIHGNTASLAGDGVSRVETANAILFSRDPHLAAIGFVWGPIPILALLPLAALKPIWPALVTSAFAGNLVSAVFMAGAVAVMLRLLTDLGLSRWLRWALTAAFALNPMIVLYAANSMSEAYFLFFLLLVARELHLWLRTRQTGRLVATGFYLGLAYLTRYESGAAAIAVTGIVGLATFIASTGGFRRRIRPALLDSIIVAAPFLVAFAGWAIASWLITGVPFQQFSSAYGNAAQIQANGLQTPSTLAQTVTLAEQGIQWMLAFEPFLPIILVACLLVVVWRRDWTALGAPAVLGAVLAFMVYVHMTVKVVPSLRYYIAVIPLVVLLVGIVLSSRSDTAPGVPVSQAGGHPSAPPSSRLASIGGARGDARLGWGRVATVTVALLAMAATIPAGLMTITNSADNPDDAVAVQALVALGPLTQQQQQASLRFVVDRQVSEYMDSMRLGRGTVLIDNFIGFVVVLSSSNLDQYVTTPDLDFQQVLADPAANGVQYVLIPPNTGLGTLDAINRAYPDAYATGKGIGTLVKTFQDHSDLGHNWRLYRVTSSS